MIDLSWSYTTQDQLALFKKNGVQSIYYVIFIVLLRYQFMYEDLLGCKKDKIQLKLYLKHEQWFYS